MQQDFPDPFKRPLVFSPGVWQAVVDVEAPFHPSEPASRFSELLLAIYREALMQPAEGEIDFDVRPFPARGDRSRRVRLELKLRRIESEHAFLHIALRGEKPLPALCLAR